MINSDFSFPSKACVKVISVTWRDETEVKMFYLLLFTFLAHRFLSNSTIDESFLTENSSSGFFFSTPARTNIRGIDSCESVYKISRYYINYVSRFVSKETTGLRNFEDQRL